MRGGKRAGAGAPRGNVNALKHGRRCRRHPQATADRIKRLQAQASRLLTISAHDPAFLALAAAIDRLAARGKRRGKPRAQPVDNPRPAAAPASAAAAATEVVHLSTAAAAPGKTPSPATEHHPTNAVVVIRVIVRS